MIKNFLISIFINITLYLRIDVIHVKLVIEKALVAICKKVIVFDFKELYTSGILLNTYSKSKNHEAFYYYLCFSNFSYLCKEQL
ncbi:MAG: phosphate-starvation-inducible PsiE family protein [Candidatus Brocadiales bacterium]|nr:phosphate-starvation-inducible PsiE family protein [Candidatus Brocadiales bacterium]